MVSWCLINEGIIKTLCIPDYVIYGIILFAAGLLMAVFIPLETGKKIGFGMVIAGIIMAIFFPLVAGWWLNPNFRIVIYIIVAFLVSMFVLFYKSGAKKK